MLEEAAKSGAAATSAIPPALRAFTIDLDALPKLRAYLVQLINGIRTVLVLELVRRELVCLVCPPDAPSFLLRMLAVARRYGRRGDSDDDALPARRLKTVHRR